MNTNILGLDIASKSCQVSLVTSDLKEVFNELFRNNQNDKDRLLLRIPHSCMVIMESTSHYHLPWARLLASHGHRVFILNPLMAKRMQTGTHCLRQNKTDKIDAYQLALLGTKEASALKNYEFKLGSNINSIRQLCKTYDLHRKALTELIVSAKMLLEMMIPEFGELDLAHNKRLSDLFLSIDSYDSLRRLHKKTIAAYACSASDLVLAVIRNPISTESEFDAYLPSLQCRLKVIQSMRAVLTETQAAIRTAAKSSPKVRADIKLAKTIPGFGPKTTAPIIASLPSNWTEWAQSKRDTARKLQAFFGFDPRKRESGKWRGTEHISKRGPLLARTALYQVALCGRLHDPYLAAIYERKRQEGVHHGIIITHLMRIQLQRLVAILVSRQAFVPLAVNSAQAA